MKLCFSFSFALFLSILFSNATFAEDGKVLFLRGVAKINGNVLSKSSVIRYGDKITTSKKTLVVVKINPGATFKIKSKTSLIIEEPLMDKKTKSLTSRFTLKTGEIFVKAFKTKKNSYQIRSKNAVLGIRGTNFFVSAASSVWMCVNEGIVEVSVEGEKKTVFVKEGQGVNINSNSLPAVKNYAWTKGLNWKMDGEYEEIEDKTNIQSINYDLEGFDYE